jgi:hypothetical protein
MATKIRIITKNHDGRVLTNNNIWTPDSRYVMYDTRSDRLGDIFDGTRIMQLDVQTGDEQCVYLSKHGAGCGVVTTHPFDDRYVFIAGPENPTSDWTYGPTHRQGMIGQRSTPYTSHPMDARELAERPIAGALRGGTHVHSWHPKGDWLRSTYNDALKSPQVRDIAVHIPGTVDVPSTHSRNHSGTYQSFIVTDTVDVPSSPEQITRAYEETWLGSTRQLAFMADNVIQGDVLTDVFVVDATPLTLASNHSFDHGNRIKPPAGITQRRLTRFAETDLRIVKKPRHWLVASPDGSTLAVLLQHKSNPPQLFTIDVVTQKLTQRTFIPSGIRTAISWSKDGGLIAFGSETAVYALDTLTWKIREVAEVQDGTLLPLVCCISPDAKKIAVQVRDGETNHIGIATVR